MICYQDDETDLLEQVIAMSMNDAMSSGMAVADTDMSDATTDDKDHETHSLICQYRIDEWSRFRYVDSLYFSLIDHECEA